ALLERLIQQLQRLLRLPPRRDLALALLVKTRIVDRDGRLRRDACHHALGAVGEDARLWMPKKQAAEHFARTRYYGHRQIAAHRRMTLRHPLVGRIMSVTWIGQNVMRANGPLAAKGGPEDRRVARHRKRERFARRPRKRIE